MATILTIIITGMIQEMTVGIRVLDQTPNKELSQRELKNNNNNNKHLLVIMKPMMVIQGQLDGRQAWKSIKMIHIHGG